MTTASTNPQPMLERLDAYDAWRWAVDLFDHRDYYAAATVLQHLVDTHPDDADLGEARELLVRSYYHAALLLSRALERSSRRDEAAAARRLSDVLGGAAR